MNIAVYGYGNLGRGVELAAAQSPDLKLTGIFSRRAAQGLRSLTGVPVYPAEEADAHAHEIDVLILCAGSAADLPAMTPALARRFHVVDSFDTHARIGAHFAAVDEAARRSGHLAVVCGGWDPGLFSLARLYAAAILPDGKSYTFWGCGVSQGHSEAIRRIPGVLDARQYTVPVPAALDAVRAGETPELTPRQMHRRECYVAAAEGADRAAIERAIVTMPHYFAPYDTAVTFLTEEELRRDHGALPHGGFVLRTGHTGADGENRQTMELRLTLASNPEFTALILAALARAAGRLAARGETGCRTIFDLAPADLSPLSGEALREQLL